MFNKNSITKRFLCVMLVLVLTITSMPASPVQSAGAEQTDLLEELKEKALEASEEQKEYAKEALVDAATSPKNLNNWRKAIFEDGLSWNYFHIRVQKDIRDKKIYFDRRELSIAVEYEKKQNGTISVKKTGRADLSADDEKIVYLWEVKPEAYASEPKRSKAKAQLDKYVNGLILDEVKQGVTSFSTLKNGMESGITIPNGTIVTDKYTIRYRDAGDGLITYSFERKPDDDDPDKPKNIKDSDKKKDAEQEYKEKAKDIMFPDYTDIKEDEKIPLHDADTTEDTTEDSGNDSGDEEEYDSSNEDFDALPEDLAAIVALTLVTIEVAKGIITLTSRDQSSVGKALKTASVKLVADLTTFVLNPTVAMAADTKQKIEDYYTMLEIYLGIPPLDEYIDAIDGKDQTAKDELIKMIQHYAQIYADACAAEPPKDPLIIDLGAEGIELKAVNHGVNFDLDNNGFAEKSAWIGTEDGFLAFDRNKNGKIDNGGELFGDQVKLKNGEKSTDGFEALKELDSDRDNDIDKDDKEYKSLLVWIDANHNGKSEASELQTLQQAGIISISLDYQEQSITDEETGTRIAETAGVKLKTALGTKTTKICEFWFPVNSSDTIHGDAITAGNVPDILQAIEEDESGELADMCLAFIEQNDVSQKRYYLKRILYRLTKADTVSCDSRGGNMDARDLTVVEQFMGHEFVGVDGSNYPNVNAAPLLKDVYLSIENLYYNLLNMYASFGCYIKAIVTVEREDGQTVLLPQVLYALIDSKIQDGEDVTELLYDTASYFSSYDKANGTEYYKDFQKMYAKKSERCKDTIALAETGFTYLGLETNDSYVGSEYNDFIFGLNGDDSLSGGIGNDVICGDEGDDTLFGNEGNDTLRGGTGDDVLDGGEGSDLLIGGKGNDTYIFAKGYGEDTIIDVSGSNMLCFSGLKSTDILVNGINDSDAVVRIKGTNDKLVLRGFMEGEEYQRYMLKFEDVSMHVASKDSPFRIVCGDKENNVLKAVLKDSYIYGYAGDDEIVGSDGSDVIYGNEGCDIIHAGAGDDIVFAGEDDDVLDGGEGNDFLYGGKGKNTYIFGIGYGTDIAVIESEKTVVSFQDAISKSDITAFSIGENVVICINDTDDRLVLQGVSDNANHCMLHFENEEITLHKCLSQCRTDYFSGTDAYDYFVNEAPFKEMLAGGKCGDRLIGAESGEYLFGDSGDDQLLANAGSDIIFGGKGHEYINGGQGDDYIDAGPDSAFVDGGEENDVYIMREGYGKLSIMDADGENTILFGDGLTADAIKAYRSDWNDLLITFSGSEDTIIIKNYCISETARHFKLIFPNGVVVDAADKQSPLRTIYGTDGSEYMLSIYSDGVTKIGQDGNDYLVGGVGEDFLYGGKGDDRIMAGAGDDVLDGGEGNDFLYGETGNDTYIFKIGYGVDTIGDTEGENIISIYGYIPEQVKATRTNGNNLTVSFENSDDKLIIEGFYNAEKNRNYYLNFNDEIKIHATDAASPFRTMYGTDGDDYIVAMDDYGVTVKGGKGNDNLNGGAGDDILIGDAGDDQLYGNVGNDTLSGGKGTDYLYGGKGDDVYRFDVGDGRDYVMDAEGANTIEFGSGICKENLTAYRTDWNDLTIKVEDTTDQLVLKDYFVSEKNRRYHVLFSDGAYYPYDDADNPIRTVHATEYDDWMDAWSDAGIILYGDKGNDHLTGGKGDDVLCGGKGNDYLNGQIGNDTYLWGKDCGSDTIEDKNGLNLIVLEDFALEDITLDTKKNGSLILSVDESGETLTILEFNSECFVFEFSDGTQYMLEQESNEWFEMLQQGE